MDTILLMKRYRTLDYWTAATIDTSYKWNSHSDEQGRTAFPLCRYKHLSTTNSLTHLHNKMPDRLAIHRREPQAQKRLSKINIKLQRNKYHSSKCQHISAPRGPSSGALLISAFSVKPFQIMQCCSVTLNMFKKWKISLKCIHLQYRH
jgi:hypothetical protein